MSWTARSGREILAFQAEHRRQNWYTIQAKQSGPSQVMIYDEIGYWGLTAQDFVNELKDLGDLDVHINSPGGEIFDGVAIYTALKNHSGVVSITVDSIAASIASVIAMGADPGKLSMAKHSQLMIHEGFGMCIGPAEDMRKTADLLDRQSDNIAGIYADRTGKSASDMRALMQAETWYSDQEAVDAGLADQVLDDSTTNKLPVDHSQKVPQVEPSLDGVFDIDWSAMADTFRTSLKGAEQ